MGSKMSKPETIKIDDVEYVRKGKPSPLGPIKIIVADRGFVYIGHMTETADFITLSRARNIRVWGTTKGLGELTQGPCAGTKLDIVGGIRFPMRAVISIIDVDESKWTL